MNPDGAGKKALANAFCVWIDTPGVAPAKVIRLEFNARVHQGDGFLAGLSVEIV